MLREIGESYDSDAHPITSPLLEGGPAETVRRYTVPHAEGYTDACHLCYEVRCYLRSRFPEILMPDQMFGCGQGRATKKFGKLQIVKQKK